MSCKTNIKKTKIICSIGPASTAPEVMSKMECCEAIDGSELDEVRKDFAARG